MKLIQNWKQAWKFNSVQTAVLIAILSGLYAAFPAFLNTIPPMWYAASMSLLSVVLLVLRLIKQDMPNEA